MSDQLIIGITGGSGSGKTRILVDLMKNFMPGSLSLLSMDNYYRPISEQKIDQNGVVNFDRPDSINRDAFHSDLRKLISGETLTIPEYTFNHLDKIPEVLTIQSAPVLLVEGIFVFHFQEIFELLDLKIFVESSEHLMMKRRIIRDANERGYDLNDVLYRYEYHVMPSFNAFTLPYRDKADIIVPNFESYDKAVTILNDHIRHFLNKVGSK